MAKYCPPNKYEAAVDLAQDDPEAGAEALQALVKKYPSDPHLRHAYGITLLQLGEPGRALPQLEQAAKRHKTSEIYSALMLTYAHLGMLRHAQRAAKRVHDLGGDAPEVDEDIVGGSVPTNAKEKDLLEFERARFDILHGATKQGLSSMTAFSKRFSEYQPALNNLATGYFVDGNTSKYREAAARALDNEPENIHALLNYARLQLLTVGPESLEPLKKRILNAPVSREDGLVDGELAQAQALALSNDDNLVADALENWERANEDIEDGFHPVVWWLEDKLEARSEEGSEAPFYSLRELVPGQVTRWQTLLGHKNLSKTVANDLKDLPGFLKLIPSYLGFEHGASAKLIAAVLLEIEDIPEVTGPWPKLLRDITLNGPGDKGTRLELLMLLKQKGVIGEDEAVEFAGMPGGVDLLGLELSFEPEESVLSESELERMTKALLEMREGKFKMARNTLETLLKRYPDDPGLSYNLALCEQLSDDLPDGEERAFDRLEQLVIEQPSYLFAKAHLALEALENDNLDRARELLRLPEGKKHIHVQEYTSFVSVQGQLALAEGEREQAENILGMLKELVGEDDPAYLMLMRAIVLDNPNNLNLPANLIDAFRGLFG